MVFADALISLTRTERLGFLVSQQRLTVALSRAATGVFVFGDANLFRSAPCCRRVLAPLFREEDGCGGEVQSQQASPYPLELRLENSADGGGERGKKQPEKIARIRTPEAMWNIVRAQNLSARISIKNN